MRNKLSTKILVAAIIILLFGLIFLVAFVKNFVQKNAPGPIFINSAGGYIFEHSPDWKAVVNQYNPDNSLFGPDASSSAGLGGVEVFKNQKSIDSFLGSVSAKYSNRTTTTVDGVEGIRESYEFYPISGQQVVLLKNGSIYNIYVNSSSSEDLEKFGEIVSSFRFINK